MKTDRLLSIVIYLLNHDTVSAAKLAEKFEVSKRTILRDIEQISLAGIPIKSIHGVNGGYSIMEGYKLDGRLVTAGDQTSIVTALKGFLSAYDGKRYKDILEKISSFVPKEKKQTVFYDFGASGENNEIQKKLKSLEKGPYETQGYIAELIDLADSAFFRLFGFKYLIVRAVPDATERIAALHTAGYTLFESKSRECYYMKESPI